MKAKEGVPIMIDVIIYQIRNTKNGRLYIGSSCQYYTRTAFHLSELRRGFHTSKLMQKDFNEHGESAFVFEPLEVITIPINDKRLKRKREYELIEQLNSEYNTKRGMVSKIILLREKDAELAKELKLKQA